MVYGVAEPHLKLTEDQKNMVKALDDDPLMQLMVKDMLLLAEDDRAQAYADFKKKWKGVKKGGDQQ
jgi:hypothetical protein